MSESTPCVRTVMADFAKGRGKGIDTEGVSLVGNVVFCDRAQCMGDFDLNSGLPHGKCNTLGVPDEGVDSINTVDGELSDALVRRETGPNQTLIRLGLIAMHAVDILTEPFIGARPNDRSSNRIHSA